MEPTAARRLWQAIEPIHALTYFGPRTQQAAEELGLKGFWMSYFACRAAPLGEVSAATVAASFYNFHPRRVARAIPDAWQFASPDLVLRARFDAVTRTAADIFGAEPEVDPELRRLLAIAAEASPVDGRALGYANSELDTGDLTEFQQLWQATTIVRESRGDGHIAALVSAELTGIQALALFSAAGGPPLDLFSASRGWSGEEFRAAQEQLRERGLLGEDFRITNAGRSVRDEVEAATDRLAAQPVRALGLDGVRRLVELSGKLTDRIAVAGLIPYPNPIGLPRK